ncbi:MAG: DUF5788 family protein [Halodesulfurarchaeum sp.]
MDPSPDESPPGDAPADESSPDESQPEGPPPSDPLPDARRQELLDRIQRHTATVGERIPETVEIDGEAFPLREFVWETKKQGTVPPDRRDEVQSVRERLQNERERRRKRLRTEKLTRQEGEAVAAAIIGIDRAITALSNLYPVEMAERSHEEYIEGNRRWVAFVDRLVE